MVINTNRVMKKRVYRLGMLTLKEESNLFKKLDKKGILYEYNYINSEKPLIVDCSTMKEEDAIALEETLLEEFGSQYLGEVEDSAINEKTEQETEVNKPEETIEESINNVLNEIEGVGENDYVYVSSDWSDIDGLVESAQKAFIQFGLYVYTDPTSEGSDQVGFIVSKIQLSPEQVKKLAYEDLGLEDNEEEEEIE